MLTDYDDDVGEMIKNIRAFDILIHAFDKLPFWYSLFLFHINDLRFYL